ncbi:MAG: hypothetical protein O7E49_10370 [Gemmatimonadetes bacterium]|nr:hypothetical protein [Gemmatimonadota bacterium]
MSIKTRRNKRGTALPAIMVLVAVLGVMAVAALRTTSDDRQASHGVRERTRAFYAAEAGIHAITASWDSMHWDNLVPQPGDSGVIPWQTIPQNGASYRGTLHNVSGSTGTKIYNLVVDGRSGGIRGGHQALSVQFAKASFLEYAVFGQGDVLFTGGGAINGDVGAGGYIELVSNNATVVGDATAGGTVIDPFTGISGTITTGATMPTIPDVACPAIPYGPAPTGPIPGHINFNAVTGDINLTGTSTKTFTSGTYFFHDLNKTSTGDLFISPSDYVVIYISRDLGVVGQGFLNGSNDPSHLIIYGCDSDTTPWTMGGGGVQHFTLYAPNHDLNLGGNGDKWGAIIAGTIQVSGTGNVYWDPAADVLASYQPVAGSWIELTD